MPSRLITLIIAVVVTALAAPAAAAQDNRAAAVNSEDEALVFELAFDFHRTMDSVVDESNTAVAYASCERCRTIAIAFQIVLAMDAAAVVVPVNLAVAVNDECTQCETLAFAYQLVLSGDQRVRLTGEGRVRIRQIRKALRALRDSDAPLDQILAELQRRAVELQDVLRTELVPLGRHPTALAEAGSDPVPSDSAQATPDPGQAAPDVGEAPSAAVEPPAVEPPPEADGAPSEAVEPPPAAPDESPAPTVEPTATATPEPTPEPTEPTPEPTPTATPPASTEPAP